MTGVEVPMAAAVDPRTGSHNRRHRRRRGVDLQETGRVAHRPRNVGIIAGRVADRGAIQVRSEEHTSELHSHSDNLFRLLLDKTTGATGVARGAAIV